MCYVVGLHACIRPQPLLDAPVEVQHGIALEGEVAGRDLETTTFTQWSTSSLGVDPEEDIWHPLHVETPFNIPSTLLPFRKSGISAIQRPDEWIEIEVTVVSGTFVTVMPASLCPGICIINNRLSRKGVEYEVANGAHILNLGERRCEMMTIGSKIC